MPGPSTGPERAVSPTANTAGGTGPVTLDVLKRRIATLEHHAPPTGGMAGGTAGAAPATVSLGLAALDQHLPWGGLPRAALHEIAAASAPAAGGFAAALLGLSSRAHVGHTPGRPVVWCRRPARGFSPGLYGAGLARFGLGPGNLILAEAGDTPSVFWAMEECLKSRAVAAVLGEPGPGGADRDGGRALRRLQLAAETSGVTAFLLLTGGARATAANATPHAVMSPAVTRWRVGARPAAAGQGDTAWRVDLTRCRGGGRPGTWDLIWHVEDGDGCDGTYAGAAAGGFRLAA